MADSRAISKELLAQYRDESGEYKVSISFNHARYCEDWQTKLDDLAKLGFKTVDANGNKFLPGDMDSIGNLVCNCASKEFSKNPIEFCF